MSLVVVGSVAYDGIETPHGRVDRVLGGACTYIALVASYFTKVRIVARLEAARLGNLGDTRSVGDRVSELRVDVGGGYRVYFMRRQRIVIVCSVAETNRLRVGASLVQNRWRGNRVRIDDAH